MSKYIIPVVVALLFCQIAFADPVNLKCKNKDGDDYGTLIIDLEIKKIYWGPLTYRIEQTNDSYITGYRNNDDDIGGDIFVINRITGEYKRGIVGFSYKNLDDMKSGKGTFSARSFEGRCVKPQFLRMVLEGKNSCIAFHRKIRVDFGNRFSCGFCLRFPAC